MYGEGVSKTGELIDLGVKAGIVEKSGSWFSFDSERIGQGRENAKQYLKEHQQVAEKIERAIRQNAGLIAGQILEGASEASGEGVEGDEAASGFEDRAVAPIAGGAARRGRR
jgi:recombination protein RecA